MENIVRRITSAGHLTAVLPGAGSAAWTVTVPGVRSAGGMSVKDPVLLVTLVTRAVTAGLVTAVVEHVRSVVCLVTAGLGRSAGRVTVLVILLLVHTVCMITTAPQVTAVPMVGVGSVASTVTAQGLTPHV